DVALLDHAEVAVARLRRMDEIGRRSGAGERRGNLARDMSGLAHAAHHDAAGAALDQLDGVEKPAVEALGEGANRVGLYGEHLARELEGRARGRLAGRFHHSRRV